MSPFFADKRVLITGGSSGIGLALAEQLVGAGARVAILARGQARLDEALAVLAKACTNEARAPLALSVDISDRAAVAEAAPRLLEGLGGGIDVLVNNAGLAHPGSFLELDDAIFDSMMAVNYFGTVNITRALAPAMIEGGGGQIVIVSSLAGAIGIYGYTAYGASKYAVRGFAESLRHDLMVHGISVHTVFPPDTDTPQLAYENQFKPAQTKAIAGTVKAMSAESVAREILAKLARGRVNIIPGTESKLVYWAARRFPGLTRALLDSALRRAERALPEGS